MSGSVQSPKATRWNGLSRTLLVLGPFYLLICLGVAGCQRRLIYFPQVLSAQDAEQMGRNEGLVRWTDEHGTPVGWKRPATSQPSQGQVLVTHGNACVAFQCAHYADVIQQAAPLDVFVVEYPGYADCPGSPSEQTLYKSTDKAFGLLTTNTPIYLLGESLGTGVAAYLAGRHPDWVNGVALLAPYNCLADVAQAHCPLLPVHLLLLDRFPSEDHLRNYRGPLAVLVGGRDRVVPEKFGRRLFDRYAGPKRLWEFPEGDHGGVMMQPAEVWSEIIKFWLESPPRPSRLP